MDWNIPNNNINNINIDITATTSTTNNNKDKKDLYFHHFGGSQKKWRRNNQLSCVLALVSNGLYKTQNPGGFIYWVLHIALFYKKHFT